MNFDFSRFLSVLDKIGYGMLGIFLVTGVIIGITMLLNKLTEKK